MSRASTARERAARLLRWYPRAWRERYGEEFAELLVSDISERPRSVTRTLDVARGGITARLADAGLTGFGVPAAGRADPYRQVRISLGSLGYMLAVFLAFAGAMWSQLMIGWQWSAVPAPAAFAAVLTSAAMLALLALAALAALPVAVVVVARLTGAWRGMTRLAAREPGAAGVNPPAAQGTHGPLAVPAAVAVAAGTILFFCSRHFGNGWPGTGGHGGFVPAGLEAFEWATSLSVSAYWAHPVALAAFPAAELAWMAASPLVLAAFAAAAVTLVRRAGLTPRMLAFEARLAMAACAVMAAFLAGAACWVATSGQRSLFHAGLIDVAGVAVLAAALAVAARAARTANRGLRLARS